MKKQFFLILNIVMFFETSLQATLVLGENYHTSYRAGDVTVILDNDSLFLKKHGIKIDIEVRGLLKGISISKFLNAGGYFWIDRFDHHYFAQSRLRMLGGNPNIKKHVKIIKNPLSNTLSIAKSLMELGKIYYFGNGVRKNYIKAQTSFETVLTIDAANVIYIADAKLYLGLIYYKDKSVSKNYIRSRTLFEEVLTIASGATLANARFRLGEIYYLANGVPENHRIAKAYFESVLTTAKASGHIIGNANSD